MDRTVNKTILKNGVKIVTKRIAHARSVSMGIWVKVGARDESSDESGLSHFIEHMIFKGTSNRTGFQIAREFDAIGGHANAFTAMENTCYHARVIDSHLETMVDILSDIFLNSLFNAKEVESERQIILQEIRMVEDSPDEYVHLLSGSAYWGDNPLGRPVLGARENIIGFDAATIKGFFRRVYQPEHIVISAAGNLVHDQFIDLIGSPFESAQPGNGLPERATPTGRSTVNLYPRELEQVHLCIGTKGLPITDPQRYVFLLMNIILGGNMSSRLFQEIRERRGIAYSVYSFISSHVDTGMFGVYAGVDPKRMLESIELILKEMYRLKMRRVDSAELHNSKECAKGGLLLASEGIDNQMVRLAQNEIHFGRYIPLQEIVDKIESVTEDNILGLTGDLFQTDRLAITLLGPVADKSLHENILTVVADAESDYHR